MKLEVWSWLWFIALFGYQRCSFVSVSLNDYLLQATGPTVVFSRQYSYKTGYRSLVGCPHRYAREVELCTKASRFLRVATHSKNQ